jgi:hypothetical protein
VMRLQIEEGYFHFVLCDGIWGVQVKLHTLTLS